jgi:hypothetical protein
MVALSGQAELPLVVLSKVHLLVSLSAFEIPSSSTILYNIRAA